MAKQLDDTTVASSAKSNDASQALSNEFINTQSPSGNTDNNTCSKLEKVRSQVSLNHNRPDTDTRGEVLAGFLFSLNRLHDTNHLTPETIKAAKQNPCFNDAEKRMLDFTDKHFKQIAGASQLDDNPRNDITWHDKYQLQTYPNAKLIDFGGTYKSNFAEKTAWAGMAVGTVVEGATFYLAPATGLAISTLGLIGAGGFVAERHNSIIDGYLAGSLAATLWGPGLGYAAGEKVGEKAAEPYWNLVHKPGLNRLFREMDTAIPTYSEYMKSQGKLS